MAETIEKYYLSKLTREDKFHDQIEPQDMALMRKAQRYIILAPTFTVAILYLLKSVQFNFLMSSNFKYTVRNYQQKYKSVYAHDKFS